MPNGNGHTFHNMHSTDLVYISKDCHCHCESINMQTMHIIIKGAIVVFISHAAGQGKIIKCDPIAGNMLNRNGYTSHNMHTTDLIYFSKYCHCHCEYLDMQTMF